MSGKRRYFYPGGNTPQGFFSYYDYIVSQDKANKIFCMKGGPGTGKSTFIKKIGEELCDNGYDIDYLMCSSDPGSLDGIIVREKNIAIVDGTAPHIVDPKNPGAVDSIINLGEYWDEEGIRKNRDDILLTNDYIKSCFSNAYKYLEGASKIYNGIEDIYDKAMNKAELYKNTAGLIYKDLSHRELCANHGTERKFFASAITPEGFKNSMASLIEECSNVYILKSPVGVSGKVILDGFKESAIARGFDVESYYCPMNPDDKPEHLIIPDIGTAIITSNRYHEVSKLAATIIDMRLYIRYDLLTKYKGLIRQSLDEMDALINMGISCLKDAKAGHDELESKYIPNMFFDKIEEKRKEILAEIKDKITAGDVVNFQ